ncbi:GAF domain-containing SpoIIE family protein phosphatase [Nocardioides ferulae]|uniref:GAF domain-containing SpoIIE family protein phosphatase n=1 Tax=Nocardioides ferulae TaxID=2340821 RepID=UPI000EB4DBB5|nr:GAF domain-containing SpoIIE family protein phosphatase [Nocardioides ferulae]
MPTLLLVGQAADARLGLDDLPMRRRLVEPHALDQVPEVEPGHEVVAVLVGSAIPESPVGVVQRVHQRWPRARVAIVVDGEERLEELRRQTTYAPGIPLELALVNLASPTVSAELADLTQAAVGGHEYDQMLAAVGKRASAPQPQLLVRATLGTLLENAPLGVLVADVDGRLLAWNHAAEDLLELEPETVGALVPTLFTEPDSLAEVFDRASAGAREVGADDVRTMQGSGGTWLDVGIAPSRLADGRDAVLLLLQDVTSRHAAEEQRDRLGAQLELIAGVSEALLSTLEPDAALRGLAEEVVPTLADWVTIQVHDDRAVTQRVVLHHRDPAFQELANLVGARLPQGVSESTPSRRIARGEEPILIEELSAAQLAEFVPDPDLRRLLDDMGVHSAIAVPLPGRDSVLGSMVLVNREGSPAFGPAELRVARELGRRAGSALETMQLYGRQRALAEELQRSMLTEPPRPGHTEIAVRYLPAADEAQVGGDWYDSFLQQDGSTVVVIGDVVGHDFRAAAAMGQLRGLLRGIGYISGSGPADLLSSLDETMAGLDIDTTASAVVAQIAPPGAPGEPRELCWSNAGHPPPVLIPAEGDPVVLAVEEADLVLGVIPGIDRSDHPLQLSPGDTVVLYTDGLIERRDQDFDEGLAALVAAATELRDRPVEDLCDELLARLLDVDHEDDVAVVAVRVLVPKPQLRP